MRDSVAAAGTTIVHRYDPMMPDAWKVIEVARVFLDLGCTSFGGPIAHIGYFREAFVRRRAWLDETRFAELLALAQTLPGPASSQLGFAIGVERAGVAGGVAAWLAFTLPSASLMFAAACGWRVLDGTHSHGLLSGLKAAAVGVVAHAVWSMAHTLAPDTPRRAIALLAAAVTALWSASAGQFVAIVSGAIAGAALCRLSSTGKASRTARVSPLQAWVALSLCAVAVAVPWSAWSVFARSGALTFGGGHVVLPLLESRLVHTGGIDASTFLAGYGVAQALPGPLFAFAAFAGAEMPNSISPTLGATIATCAIFAPGLLLMIAAMPLLGSLRTKPRAMSALMGVNAAVVGLLLAALLGPVQRAGIASVPTACIVVAMVAMLSTSRWPVPVLVLLAGALGAAVA
jgi:chromate transporter